MSDWVEVYPSFEPGFSVRFSATGQLQFAMNTPNGHIVQETTLHPLIAWKLHEWLKEQDWYAIRKAAVEADAENKTLWPEWWRA